MPFPLPQGREFLDTESFKMYHVIMLQNIQELLHQMYQTLAAAEIVMYNNTIAVLSLCV